jgi:hypothetical protein
VTEPRSESRLERVLSQVRIATRADNDFLVDLMAHVPMEGSLVVSTRRDPDFFALYEIQRGAHEVYCVREPFQGVATIVSRGGYLDGRAQPLAYLGDLRIRGSARERMLFPAAYGVGLSEHAARTGCEAYYTGILAENALAIASLTKRDPKSGSKRKEQPRYTLITPYVMASIQVLWPPRARTVSGLRVRTATDADVPRLAQFLHEDHRARAFGYRFDDGELEHRLAHWPGFSLDSTFVAEDDSGRLVGTTTAWDPSPVKRYRVVRYAGAMRALRLGMRAASAVLGCPPLPREGEDFKTLYLTNLSVKDDDARILRALLFAVYPHAWRARAHLIALPLWGDADPHEAALKGFAVQRLAFHLYGVTPPGKERAAWPSARPGFEIALA